MERVRGFLSNLTGSGKQSNKEETKVSVGESKDECSKEHKTQSENVENKETGDVKLGSEAGNYYIQLGGVPRNATPIEIAEFLTDCKLVGTVVFIENEEETTSHTALVRLLGEADKERALKCNKKYFKQSWFIVIDEIDGQMYDKEMRKLENKKVESIADKPDGIALSKVEQEAAYCYIKLNGLPWKATEKEIAKFLVDCNIVGNIFIIKNERGKPSGDAVLKLMGKTDLGKAMKCNRKYLHDRFVVIEEIERNTYNKHIGKKEEENAPENEFLKINGLAWTATEDDIKTLLFDCKIREVVITTNEMGKPSGNAFVHLDSKSDAEKARSHNKEYIHGRFVIVEVIKEQQFKMETERDRNPNNQNKKYSDFHVMLNSLPWTCSEMDIREYLKDCSIKSVIILENSIGKPSGKAIVELQSKEDQVRALILNKKLLGNRTIDVEKVETKDVDIIRQMTGLKTNKTINVNETREKILDCVNIIEEENHQTSCVLDKVTYKFEIKPLDTVADEEEVLEDCKDVALEGVFWEKGEIIPVANCKSKIILSCIVEGDIDAGTIRKALEKLEHVEDVTIIH